MAKLVLTVGRSYGSGTLYRNLTSLYCVVLFAYLYVCILPHGPGSAEAFGKLKFKSGLYTKFQD